jgi:hypothetical protein
MWSSVLRTSVLAAAVAAPIAAAPQSAQAQSPMPIGLWQGQNSRDLIQINGDGSCSARGTVNVAGTCEWLPTSTGGVLNMYYPMPLQPGRTGWSVTWLDRNTLLINAVATDPVQLA